MIKNMIQDDIIRKSIF